MELKPGYKQTEIGVIPEDWDTALLDSVAKRGSGHTPSKSFPEYWDGEIKWISLQDSGRLDQLYIRDTAVHITPAGIANSSAYLHQVGTVVLSRDAGVGKSAIMAEPMAVSQHFMAWSCKVQLSNIFLYFWLQSTKAEFERMAIGNTIKTIGLGYFKELVIPLPPIAEQETIAEALSHADALIESLEQLIAKKRFLKQGAMQDLLTGKKRLPGFDGEWETVSLGELFAFKNGLNKSKEFFGHGTPIVNYMDVFKRPKIMADDLQGKVSLSRKELNAYDVKCGDVFFTRTSETLEEVGMAAVVLGKPVDTVFSGFVLRARSKDNRLENAYKAFCFRAPSVRTQIVSKGSYTTRALTNGRALSMVSIALPELAEQTAIAAILSDMDAEIAALEAKLAKARQVKQGMMQELLTGKTRLV